MSHPHLIHSVSPLGIHSQRGAAFLVMLVIIIIGVTAALVGVLGKATLQIERGNKSSDLLARSKEAVLGYAVSGGSRPGDLPYQDRLVTPTESGGSPNYDGNQDLCPGLTGCLGRLPWRTLGLSIDAPSENDPAGFMPWYAVSANLVDPTGVTLNSELLNTAPHPWLTVLDMNGNVLSNRVAFVILIPGTAINGQSRPPSPSLGGANQYLDSITVPAGCTTPCIPGTYSNADADNSFIMGEEHRWIDDLANPGKQIEDSGYFFNDKLIYITIDELMPLVEKRIGREAKSCLDKYAASSSSKYPWAAPISPLGYTSTNGTRFGRIPDAPTVNTTAPLNAGNASDSNILTMLNAMAAVQTAVDNCLAASNAANQSALASAGLALQQAATTVQNNQPTVPAISSSVTDPAIVAGQRAQSSTRCFRIYNHFSTSVQTNLANANSALGSVTVSTPEDATMQLAWPAGCFVAGTYWDEWKNLVLYQVADSYRPLSAATSCAGTCLSISGSGNPDAGSGSYRAGIILAGKKLGAQTRASQSISEYLESNNQTAPATLIFNTYKPTDSAYSTVNDLVLCLDGKINCK